VYTVSCLDCCTYSHTQCVFFLLTLKLHNKWSDSQGELFESHSRFLDPDILMSVLVTQALPWYSKGMWSAGLVLYVYRE